MELDSPTSIQHIDALFHNAEAEYNFFINNGQNSGQSYSPGIEKMFRDLSIGIEKTMKGILEEISVNGSDVNCDFEHNLKELFENILFHKAIFKDNVIIEKGFFALDKYNLLDRTWLEYFTPIEKEIIDDLFIFGRYARNVYVDLIKKEF